MDAPGCTCQHPVDGPMEYDQDCPYHGWDEDTYGEHPLGGSWS